MEQREQQATSPQHPHVPLSSRRAAGMAEADDNCYRCGYPLLGIADEQGCPECGLLARRSRRTTDELHNTRPRWLRRISRGADLILLAVVLVLAWPYVWHLPVRHGWGYLSSLSSLSAYGVHVWELLSRLGTFGAATLVLVGAWLLTAREGYPPADRADRRLRVWLRLCAMIPLIGAALQSGFGIVRYSAFGSPWYDGIDWTMWGDIGWPLFLLAVIPLPLLLFAHLRGLARRARSAHLAEHCAIAGVGTSATLALVAAFIVVVEHSDEWGFGTYWFERSTSAFVGLFILALAGSLFLLWSLYLFVRFVHAFRRAARALRGKWRDDDRSLAGAAAATPPVTP